MVLVPGLAVSTDGLRLGAGGGSYDRALGRVPVGTFTCVLLYDGEVGRDVPVEPHDRPVTAAVTPRGVSAGSGPTVATRLLVRRVGRDERQRVPLGGLDRVAA